MDVSAPRMAGIRMVNSPRQTLKALKNSKKTEGENE